MRLPLDIVAPGQNAPQKLYPRLGHARLRSWTAQTPRGGWTLSTARLAAGRYAEETIADRPELDADRVARAALHEFMHGANNYGLHHESILERRSEHRARWRLDPAPAAVPAPF